MWIVAIVVAAVVALFLLVWWHARTFAYRCRSCDNKFEISVLTDLVSPHGIGLKGDGWKLLHCARCGGWPRARVVRKRPKGSESTREPLSRAIAPFFLRLTPYLDTLITPC